MIAPGPAKFVGDIEGTGQNLWAGRGNNLRLEDKPDDRFDYFNVNILNTSVVQATFALRVSARLVV
ncbi:hypothetical protein [uncultured Paracoccus sp.]|uniref:hypothetical protein n=1 Tax=uncultured Paracoccus sp. TaxID=189685 RepID=UPI00262AD8EE|nr:hypothetical protein [uncultured Paracoccus sp.]